MALIDKNSGNTMFLNVDFSKKSLYHYSSTDEPGYTKHVTEKGRVSYRRYISSVIGTICGAYFRDGNFGKEFHLRLCDEGENYDIGLGIEDNLFYSLARLLNNVNVDEQVKISVYGAQAQGGDKVYARLSMSYVNIMNDEGKSAFVDWDEDAPVKPKTLRNGNTDWSEISEYSYEQAEKFIEDNNFQSRSSSSSSSTKETSPTVPKTKAKAAVVVNNNTEDDLPF